MEPEDVGEEQDRVARGIGLLVLVVGLVNFALWAWIFFGVQGPRPNAGGLLFIGIAATVWGIRRVLRGRQHEQ